MVLTGQADLGAAMAAVNEGHIFHFLNKPCEKSVLTHSIKEAIAHYLGRREQRVEVELPVLLYRSTSGREGELVHTVDISNSGARIRGIQQPPQVGEMIAIQYAHREAPFEVVWVGCRSAGTGVSAGLRCLTSDGKIWGTALSQADWGEPLRRDMRVASSVQMKLLPSELPMLQTLEYSGHCIQARSVGAITTTSSTSRRGSWFCLGGYCR